MKVDDGASLPKLSPEWLAMIMMDVTAHLMAALDKAAAPLDRIANAAEDAIAHVKHSRRCPPKRLANAEYPEARLGIMARACANGNHQAISLDGIEYRFLERKSCETRLATAKPEEIGTYLDDGAPPPKLSPEWLAMIMMDMTAHLMAALDKAAAPLDRIANAAEDAIAHVEHSTRRLLKTSTSGQHPQSLMAFMSAR